MCVGEVVSYARPNGSGGETTTNRLLASSTLDPSSGSILFEGRGIHEDVTAYRRRLGYVPEEPFLYPFLSGLEYLELVGRLREIPAALLDRKARALLELFNLAAAAEQAISSYSKGMKQKLLIIAALLHDPDLLILDEPDSGLDATSIIVMRHLVRTLADRGKAVLYSSHVLELVEKLCTRVIVLHRGEIVANDSPEHLRALMHRESLEEVFAQLVLRVDPEATAHDIADVVGLHA